MANLPVVPGPPRPQFAPGGQMRPNWNPQQQQQMQMGQVMVDANVRTPQGSAKRSHPSGGGQQAVGPVGPTFKMTGQMPTKRRKKIADKILPPQIRDLVPESQAYMDLLAFEKKLDSTISRKKLDIQEALKRPMKVKRKLRIYITNTFFPPKESENEADESGSISSWELRVEGRLFEDLQPQPPAASPAAQQRLDAAKPPKRKFSSFFKSLVIELDKDIYGPDNHLVEWHRTPSTHETDGFQVKRPGDRNVKCTILLLLDYQPMKFKLDPRLARLLGIHAESRPKIIEALWQYIKTHRLQDPHERDYINCDRYLEQVFQCSRMRFMEIPNRLHQLLHSPDPIVINHVIGVDGPDSKKTCCYDIDVEIDDPLKNQMSQFMMSQQSLSEIANLDTKIHETVEQIEQLKLQREFYLGFAQEPLDFIQKWLISQSRDLKVMTDVVGNPEEERKVDFYFQPTTKEAVGRYFHSKIQLRKLELEQNIGIRNN